VTDLNRCTNPIAFPPTPHAKHLKIFFSTEMFNDGELSSWNGQTAT
jgi:hypothetical protein